METINFPKKTLKVSFNEWESKIPYYIIKGKRPGPKIFISAGMHGAEINGIAIVRTFLEKAQKENLIDDLYGSIVVIPVINISGFNEMKRQVQEDKRDLNRAFGKYPIKSFSEALADKLTTQIFSKCSLGIDCHDAGASTILMPHVRIHKDDPEGLNRALGRAFGTKVLIKRKANQNMMAEHLRMKHNVPVITVEIGGAQIIDEEAVNEGVQGIYNILIHTKMLKTGTMVIPKKQFFLTNRIGIKTLEGGEIHIHRKLGESVEAGDELGWIHFPQTQKTEILRAPTCGFVFAKWIRNQIPKNGTMYGILEDKSCPIAKSEALDELDRIPEFMIRKHNFSG